MAVQEIGTGGAYGDRLFHGLSTDTKPTTGVLSNSMFYELDTGIWWVYSTKNTNAVTSNGWWKL